MGSVYQLNPVSDNDRLLYINTDIPSGNTISSTTETPFVSSFTVPAGGLAAGVRIRVEAYGLYTTLLTASSMIVNLKVAGTTIATATLPISLAATNKGWSMRTTSIIQNMNGNMGTFDTQGIASFDTNNITIANATPYTVDSSVDMPVTMTARFSGVALSSSIQLRQLYVDVANLT